MKSLDSGSRRNDERRIVNNERRIRRKDGSLLPVEVSARMLLRLIGEDIDLVWMPGAGL